ncbi:MAG TPA: helix-turn-helix transcriptional regulator [Candidatus Scybalocola faecigallinarum]|uniref:Helix-turn-helix transcriptional regulator n=1 Tax=Candidatus Scybalocola faecigallinarum TaxID=2840941 RepID=A0A9D1JRY3_9FIRM|nr:helix-turn-helix transcriptional regulator [Candidatus Scybalocola faecigallinarum]
MIDYSPFWKTLENSNEDCRTLIKEHGVSNYVLLRLKNNEDVSMRTINRLCQILDCQIQDIMEYIP